MKRFASVVLVDARGWILLQERDEFPVIDPEKWGLPGGHLDGDEDPLTGAARELAEETGVDLGPDELTLWRDVEVFHEAYDSLDRMWVYAARADVTDDDIVVGEGRRIVFVDPAAVTGLDLTASARLTIPAFLDSDLYASMAP